MRKMIVAAAVVAALLGMPLTAAAAGHSEFFVNGLSGNDSSSCQSPRNGCLTIQAAIDRIPIVLDRHVSVHVAPGTYAESLILADRLAPKGHEIRLIGDAEGVRLNGMKERQIGILIRNSPRVVLENFEVTEFTEAGVLVLHSDVSLANARIVWNLSHGVVCEYSHLLIETGAVARGVSLLGNAGSGLLATGCHVRFQGPAIVADNNLGLLSSHGGLIDLAARSDVMVTNNPPQPPGVGSGGTGGGGGGGEGPRRYRMPPLAESEAACQLVADCHGMIMGYENARIDGPCVCAGTDYGICHP